MNTSTESLRHLKSIFFMQSTADLNCFRFPRLVVSRLQCSVFKEGENRWIHTFPEDICVK